MYSLYLNIKFYHKKSNEMIILFAFKEKYCKEVFENNCKKIANKHHYVAVIKKSSIKAVKMKWKSYIFLKVGATQFFDNVLVSHTCNWVSFQ